MRHRRARTSVDLLPEDRVTLLLSHKVLAQLIRQIDPDGRDLQLMKVPLTRARRTHERRAALGDRDSGRASGGRAGNAAADNNATGNADGAVFTPADVGNARIAASVIKRRPVANICDGGRRLLSCEGHLTHRKALLSGGASLILRDAA